MCPAAVHFLKYILSPVMGVCVGLADCSGEKSGEGYLSGKTPEKCLCYPSEMGTVRLNTNVEMLKIRKPIITYGVKKHISHNFFRKIIQIASKKKKKKIVKPMGASYKLVFEWQSKA